MSGWAAFGYRIEHLNDDHQLQHFDCGTTSLNGWLAMRALRNQRSGASRTFVAVEPDTAPLVCGYASLAASAVALDEAPGPIRRNMPDPIPVVLLGRLATDRAHRGRGLGGALLKDAVRRTISAAESVGVRALLVHAIDDDAVAFYRHFGFMAAPFDDRTLFLPLEHARSAIGRRDADEGGAP